MIAPDATTFDYIRGREFAPKDHDKAVAHWETFAGDAAATFDRSQSYQGQDIQPQITWGTNPGQVTSVMDKVPDPADFQSNVDRKSAESALEVYGSDQRNTAGGRSDRSRLHRVLHERQDRGSPRGGEGLGRPQSVATREAPWWCPAVGK